MDDANVDLCGEHRKKIDWLFAWYDVQQPFDEKASALCDISL